MSRYLNMSDYDKDENQDFGPLPEGDYVVFIQDDLETGGVNRQRGGAGDYLSLTLRILSPEKYSGFRLWSNLSFSQKALWKVAQLYRAVEPEAQHRNPQLDLDSNEELHRELFYKPMIVSCSHETRNGKKYLKVDWFNPIKDVDEVSGWLEEMELMIAEHNDCGEGPSYDARDEFPPQQQQEQAPPPPQQRQQKRQSSRRGTQPNSPYSR